MPEVPLPFPLAPPQIPQRLGQQATADQNNTQRKAGQLMKVSIPLVAILVLVVYLTYRYMGLRVWQAILCLLLGFLIAATTAAPTIHQLLFALVQWLNHP